MAKSSSIISPEFKKAGSRVVLLQAKIKENGLPDAESLNSLLAQVQKLIADGRVLSAYVPGFGGVAEAIMKMCLGNSLGFHYDDSLTVQDIFGYTTAAFILELAEDMEIGKVLGYTDDSIYPTGCQDRIRLDELRRAYESRLEDVYPTYTQPAGEKPQAYSYSVAGPNRARPKVAVAKPTFLLPVFPGTNCEYDTARAIEAAGGRAEILVLNNLTPEGVSRSVERFAAALRSSQAVVIPGGFSGGDEPDGSGKFITAFFRNPIIKEEVTRLLEERDGLMCGICNGFQALIKLGLVPFGRIVDADADSPTLTYNIIGRHQSRLVRTRIASNKSPWLANTQPGDIYTIPVSHGEGRFICNEELLAKLAANGQIAAQYVDENGEPSMLIWDNPNGSVAAVEAITSPDGRVLGKMGHSERIGADLYRNVPGNFDMQIFAAAVKYFRG